MKYLENPALTERLVLLAVKHWCFKCLAEMPRNHRKSSVQKPFHEWELCELMLEQPRESGPVLVTAGHLGVCGGRWWDLRSEEGGDSCLKPGCSGPYSWWKNRPQKIHPPDWGDEQEVYPLWLGAGCGGICNLRCTLTWVWGLNDITCVRILTLIN